MSYNTNYIFCTRSDHIWKSGLFVLVELGPTKKRYVAGVTENEIINAIALFRVECNVTMLVLSVTYLVCCRLVDEPCPPEDLITVNN